MEGKVGLNRLNFFRGLVIIYAVGLAGHIIGPSRPIMFFLTPVVLILSCIIIIIPEIIEKNWKVLIWLTVSGVVTFLIEAAGVATGKIFGPYSYGHVLGPKLLDVPFVISVNWIIVIYGSINISQIFLKNRILCYITSVFLPVLFDFIMEPVAVKFNYWNWDTVEIPLQNYLAWFAISLVINGVFFITGLKSSNRLSAFYFAILCVYFLVLRFAV